jgi:hypothetical protein
MKYMRRLSAQNDYELAPLTIGHLVSAGGVVSPSGGSGSAEGA